MGTVVTIDAYHHGGVAPEELLPHLATAVDILHHADSVFSTWRADSPLSQLRGGTMSLGEAPPEVSIVLSACRDARELTRGWFDPWAMPGGVDPTGYVKGWAAQRALWALRGAPIDGAILNAAGDIAVFGRPDPGQPFRVGVVRPDSTLELACVVELAGAIATSGTYERGEHLVNPRTGERRAVVASASVTGPDLGLADALATALAVGGDEVFCIVETLSDYEALLIDDAGLRATSRFPFSP